MKQNNLVAFMPSGKRASYAQGTKLLKIAKTLGVDLENSCGGVGTCGKCQVEPVFGEFAKLGIKTSSDCLNQWSDTEQEYVTKNGKLRKGRRLACCVQVKGDLVINVPKDSQVFTQVVRKSASNEKIEIEPVTKLYYLEVETAELMEANSDNSSSSDCHSDVGRVINALQQQWNVKAKSFDINALRDLQSILRLSSWKISVAVRDEIVTAVFKGLKKEIYGVAIDLGSTTISCDLCNLITGEVITSVGVMNPQIRFGEDLMSRVSYIMMNADGVADMNNIVVKSVGELITKAIIKANNQNHTNIDLDSNNKNGESADKNYLISAQDIMEVVVVGNTIMHHLFLGINPKELGFAPFALAIDGSIDIKLSDIGIVDHTNKGARLYMLPCIAGHVGGDAAGVALACRPYQSEKRHLIIDVGTNAEIIYGNKEKLFACSSPTGPALEGAQISSGGRASVGAIERVRIDPETFEPKFKVIGCDLWSTDAGFQDSVKEFGVSIICGSGIIEVIADMFLAGLINEDGIINGELCEKTPRLIKNGKTWSYLLYTANSEKNNAEEYSKDILITQDDVRAIQLAKAALYSGCKLLIDKFGLLPEKISLAGAFGSHIDTKYAMVLGFLPDCDLDKVHSIGNSAGQGARMALLNKSARLEIEKTVKEIEKIETALEPNFQKYFIDAIAIPNKVDAYVNLRQKVKMPINTGKPSESRRKNRRNLRNK